MFTVARYHTASSLSCPLCYPESPAKPCNEECARSSAARRVDVHAAAVECVETLHPHRPVNVQELLARVAAIEARLAEGRRSMSGPQLRLAGEDTDAVNKAATPMRRTTEVTQRRSASRVSSSTADLVTGAAHMAELTVHASPTQPGGGCSPDAQATRSAVSTFADAFFVAEPSRMSLISDGDSSRAADGVVLHAGASSLAEMSQQTTEVTAAPTLSSPLSSSASVTTAVPHHPKRQWRLATAKESRSPSISSDALLAAVLRERFQGLVEVADALTDLVSDLMCEHYTTSVQRTHSRALLSTMPSNVSSPSTYPIAERKDSPVASGPALPLGATTLFPSDNVLFEVAYARFLEVVEAARTVLAEHQLSIAAVFSTSAQSILAGALVSSPRNARSQKQAIPSTFPSDERSNGGSDVAQDCAAGHVKRLRERYLRHLDVLEELMLECQEAQVDTYFCAVLGASSSWLSTASHHVPHPPTTRPVRRSSVERRPLGFPLGQEDMASQVSLLEQIYEHCENRKRYWFTDATSRVTVDWFRSRNRSQSPTATAHDEAESLPSQLPDGKASAEPVHRGTAVAPAAATARGVPNLLRRLTLRMEGLQQILQEYLDDYQERTVDVFQSAIKSVVVVAIPSLPAAAQQPPLNVPARATPSADRSVSLTQGGPQELLWVRDAEKDRSSPQKQIRSDSPDPQPEERPPPSQHAARPLSYAGAAASKRTARSSMHKRNEREPLLQPPWNRSTALGDRSQAAPNATTPGGEVRSRSNSSRRDTTAKYSAALQQQQQQQSGYAGIADTDSLCRPTSSFLESTSLRFRVAYWDRHRHVAEGHCRHCADHWCEELNLH